MSIKPNDAIAAAQSAACAAQKLARPKPLIESAAQDLERCIDACLRALLQLGATDFEIERDSFEGSEVFTISVTREPQ